MNIFKNFLPKKDFNKLKNYIMSDYFPWYYNDFVLEKKDNFFQFTFVFLDEKGINCSKEIMNIINIVLSKIKYNKLTAVKANLLTKTKNIIEHGFHIDQNIGTTGILYLDNSNGYTKFENGKKIKSEENKYVEFDSTLKHTGSTCTDEMRRVVINFNYESI